MQIFIKADYISVMFALIDFFIFSYYDKINMFYLPCTIFFVSILLTFVIKWWWS